MRARLDAANIRNLGLRYVARLARDGKAHVGLVALPAEDACLHTRLTDNLVQFHNRRYDDTPLVLQGPGAGPEVPGAGVLGDMLALASTLGSRSLPTASIATQNASFTRPVSCSTALGLLLPILRSR